MIFRDFIRQCLHGWTIAALSTCGTDCGVMRMRSHDTYIKVFFNLNGDSRWTGQNVTLDHIEASEDLV